MTTRLLAFALMLSAAGVANAQEPPADPSSPMADPVPAQPDPLPAGEDVGSTASAPAEPIAVEAEGGDDAPYLIGIAPRIGLTIPTSKLGAMVAGGLEIGMLVPSGPPLIRNHLGVALDLAITRPGFDGDTTDPRVGDATYEIKETEYKVAIDATYRWPLPGSLHKLVPVGGLGPIMQILRTNEDTSLAPGTNTATKTKFGFELFVGADYRLGPGFVLGDLRFVYSDLHDLLSGNSNAGNVILSAGYRITL